MRYFVRRMAASGALMLLPWTALAGPQACSASDDSGNGDLSPTPTPSSAYHRHSHASLSPTPAGKTISGDADSDSDSTPSSKRKRHRHPVVEEDAAGASASAGPVSSAYDSDVPDIPSATPKPHLSAAPDASLDPDQLEGFPDQPVNVQALIRSALDLTRQNLTYTFSSADPANGGMDCSGFIYYILTKAGIKDVPRDASEQYSWVRKAENFRAVISRNLDGFELDELKPGDLLFWSNTYKTDRDPPVTHTMIYLGREKTTGNRVMVGSSDGRSYQGLQRWGVSVFDFKAPAAEASPSAGHPASQFIGYGSIPGL